MTEFLIKEEDFRPLQGKHVVLTGASSGIGLATVKLLLEHGAIVTAGDLNPIPIEHKNLSFATTNVTSWDSLSAFFKEATKHHPTIDHVFANAGITRQTTYLEEEFDAKGALLEPTHRVFDVNLKGMINTCYLGLHYMRKSPGSDNSIVVTASASSFQRFRAVDYTTTKHGVLGFMRGLVPTLATAGIPIRVNGIAPSWTATNIAPGLLLEKAGIGMQGPDVVARSVAVLMADKARVGQLIYSSEGRFKEVEDAVLLKALPEILFPGQENEDEQVVKLTEAAAKMSQEAQGPAGG